jgi:hypothetical protein
VQFSFNLSNWSNLGTALSATTNFAFTNAPGASNRLYYRVTYP